MGFFDTPFKQEPQIVDVTIHVHWCTKDEIEKRTQNENAYGCGEVGQSEGNVVHMWLLKPDSFNGVLVEAMGHELLHALGATHE